MFHTFLSEPASVILAIAVFFFMIWPGYAVLHLLGFGFNRWSWAPFAGPAVTLALWIITLSGGVWARFTSQQTAIPVWAGTFVLAVIGLALGVSSWRKATTACKANDSWLWLVAGATVVIPLLVMPASFRFGLADFANSNSADSWSYVAVADYFLTIPRGKEGGLSALHQYAAHLMGTRNATSAILGFLSIGLGSVKVSQAVVLFCLMVLFANATALVAFAATVFGRVKLAGAFLVIVGIGWPANVVLAGNFDQLLLMPLLPTLAALAFLAGTGHRTARAAIVVGILAAATFYAYVELSMPGLLVAMSLIAVPNVSILTFSRRVALVCCIALPIAAVLTWPAFDALLIMLKNQYIITGASVRPGEGYFSGLVSRFDWFGALWALGPEHLLKHGFIIGNGIGIIFLFVMGVGVWAERKRYLAILGLAFIAAAFIYFTYSQHYSYAAYKVVSVNFWLMGLFVVSGLMLLSSSFMNDAHSCRKLTVAAVAGLLMITGLRLAAENRVTNFTLNGIQQRNFREIQIVAEMIQKEPTLLAVRDPFANEWAVFYLSDTPMIIAPYRLYMAQSHVIPFMSRAQLADPASIRYIVTDRNDLIRNRVAGARQIWEGKVYRLWAVDRSDWAVLTDFNNPNGLESDAHTMWAWLGGPPAEFIIVAGRAGVAELTGRFDPGPQTPQNVVGIHISLTDASGRRELLIRQSANRLPIKLLAGRTTVTMKVEEEPSSLIPAGGDARPLIVRFTDIMIRNIETPP